MIELPVLIENIIEIVNVAIEMMLVFLYFSFLSKAKVNKAVLYLSYLLSTVILSATVLLTDNILVYLITTIILITPCPLFVMMIQSVIKYFGTYCFY